MTECDNCDRGVDFDDLHISFEGGRVQQLCPTCADDLDVPDFEIRAEAEADADGGDRDGR